MQPLLKVTAMWTETDIRTAHSAVTPTYLERLQDSGEVTASQNIS